MHQPLNVSSCQLQGDVLEQPVEGQRTDGLTETLRDATRQFEVAAAARRHTEIQRQHAKGVQSQTLCQRETDRAMEGTETHRQTERQRETEAKRHFTSRHHHLEAR